MTANQFEYEGHIYVRPLGRGIVLGDPKVSTGRYRYLDDVIDTMIEASPSSGGYAKVKITVEVFPSVLLP